MINKEREETRTEALKLAAVLSVKTGQFLNCGGHSRYYAKYWEELKEAKEEYDNHIFNNTLKKD
tara:strand:+ start:358 stop:549 length:192 start_codon:yes stop_codon:yes gene_type:complete